MENVDRSWGPVFYEDHLDPNVDGEEIRHLTDLGLDFPFHVVETE
jgi:hypothetical protein